MSETRCWLLVEDDPDDQEFFLDTLHEVSVCTACYATSNGEEALDALTNVGVEPDLIFTDLNMPRMNGLEFLKLLRSMEKFRKIPVVIYTSDFSEELIQKTKAFGVRAIYSKTRISALKEILKRHLSENPLSV